MLAVKKNMEDQTGLKFPRVVMYCYECGAMYSADKGDYWNYPDDHTFTCCGVPCVLGRKETRFVPE